MADRSSMEQMANVLARRPWPFRLDVFERKPDESKTEQIRALLRSQGPLNAAAIVMEIGLDGGTALVGALLKNDLYKGAVIRQGGCYAWNHDYDQALANELAEARALLRRHGYRVEKV